MLRKPPWPKIAQLAPSLAVSIFVVALLFVGAEGVLAPAISIGCLAFAFAITAATRSGRRKEIGAGPTTIPKAASNTTFADDIATLSHDLRAPLANVIGLLELAQEAPAPRDRAALIERALTNARRLLDLLVAILDEAQPTSRRIEPCELSLERVVREAVETVGPAAERKRLCIEVRADAHLPPVRSHPARLTRVLTNLLDNAVKYTGRGGTVRITITSAGSFAHVNVADAGPGLAAGQLSQLFRRFQRGPRSRGAAGYGLGLFIAQQLVRSLNGRLEARSEHGRGCSFTVILPLEPVQEYGPIPRSR
ncbi:MAG: hypothetical protein KatS3mg077_3034 [Candidatus Binatia bacterium]|nr:MAG: hypothetical protein KatS3mg077_3034 [Candidatus Binatia bacterium]